MNVLLFNGALERRTEATSHRLVTCLEAMLRKQGVQTSAFQLADSGIPVFDPALKKVPLAVELMARQFRDADAHIWLTPLYHGGMTGVMKNCLDWLEISSGADVPYLTDKTIGLVCWADGIQALQGINAMDAVAKALRAWTLPFGVPIVRARLFDGSDGEVSEEYRGKLELLTALIARKQVYDRRSALYSQTADTAL